MLAVSSLWALLATPAALADSAAPTTCVAVWRGPTATCPWSHELEARASGRSETTARRLAWLRLRLALSVAAEARQVEAAGTVAAVEVAKLRSCARLPEEEVAVTCFAQEQLAGEGLCFADLPADPTCWDTDMLVVEGTRWKVQEQARQQVCAEVEAGLGARDLGDAHRLRCMARCLTEVRVRCP